MALSFKDPETDRLAREVAKLTGESLTAAVRSALVEKLEREYLKRVQPADKQSRLRQINDIINRANKLPILDPRTADEIIGYNESGLFS